MALEVEFQRDARAIAVQRLNAWTVNSSFVAAARSVWRVDPAEANTLYGGLRDGGVRRSTVGGRTWVDCALPEGGVFSLTVSAADGAVYAGTEPSLFRSDDGGASWQDHRPGAQRDMHKTWQPADEGRDRHYTWSVAVDRDDPELWYVSASTGPYAAHGRGEPQARIYRRRADEPWRALADGLPQPLPAMVYALVAADSYLCAS